MSWKRLFSRSLAGNPRHFAAHSHHLWPDASFDGQQACWTDAATLADRKWGRIMDEVWPEAQGHVARELNLPDPQTIVFAGNTHDLLIRIASSIEHRPRRIAHPPGEFHSFRRQMARWVEAGEAMEVAMDDAPDLIWASHVRFNSGEVLGDLASLITPNAIAVADGYHAFMAIPVDLSAVADRLFYVAGGYKYAMAGEGVAFAHCPPGFVERPVLTGWYAEFDDLSLPPGSVGYAKDARRLIGATFDASGLYRFNAVRRMLDAEGLTTATIAGHVTMLQARFLDANPLPAAVLLNPLDGEPHARFLAFRSSHAPAIHQALAAAGVTTDVRGDVIRIGFGLYHDAADVDALVAELRRIAP
jgi:selenocysteine lyase/cysteine desulfurase